MIWMVRFPENRSTSHSYIVPVRAKDMEWEGQDGEEEGEEEGEEGEEGEEEGEEERARCPMPV